MPIPTGTAGEESSSAWPGVAAAARAARAAGPGLGAPVDRRRVGRSRVGERRREGHVVAVYAVARRQRLHQPAGLGRALDRLQGAVDHVLGQTPAVGEAARAALEPVEALRSTM